VHFRAEHRPLWCWYAQKSSVCPEAIRIEMQQVWEACDAQLELRG